MKITLKNVVLGALVFFYLAIMFSNFFSVSEGLENQDEGLENQSADDMKNDEESANIADAVLEDQDKKKIPNVEDAPTDADIKYGISGEGDSTAP